MNKEELDNKLGRSICVLLTANKFKNDTKKFSEFIIKNKTYFPFIKLDIIEKISGGIPANYSDDIDIESKIPVFPELKK